MRPATAHRALLLTALLLAIGCTPHNLGRIEGTTWTSEPTTVRGRALGPGDLRLEFHRDGRLVYQARGQTYRGSYQLGLADVVHFHLEPRLGGAPSHAQRIVVEGDRLTLIDADGTTACFRRDLPPPPSAL